ncbi:MAG: DUF262 domain-containing protein [Thiolinea sp.]
MTSGLLIFISKQGGFIINMTSYDKVDLIENQIFEQRKTVDFDTRELTIEYYVNKYLTNIEKDKNEIYVPGYQREFVWEPDRQSRLIESIILGLPIPILFVAETKDGRLEVVDGSQRIRTFAAYLSDDLKLEGLEKLTELNNTIFSELPISRKNKIKNTPIRMVVLSETTTEQVKKDLFERINRGSDVLRNMEKRKGIYQGPFVDFIYNECVKNPLLTKLAPLSKVVEKRQEHEELILRFFALVDTYPNFTTQKRGIGAVLDEYIQKKNESFSNNEKEEKLKIFNRMLSFVDKHMANGFSKWKDQAVSRVFFEAVSVGAHLVIEENPDFRPVKLNPGKWLSDDKYFKSLVSGKYRTHAPDKMLDRIHYVRDKILNVR